MRKLFAAILMCFATAAAAQLSIEITGAGATRIPIAIAPFAGEGALAQGMSAIVRADLERSGLFRALEMPPLNPPLTEASQVNYAEWKSRLADALVLGSVAARADGRFEVRFKLFDTVKGADLSGVAYTLSREQARTTAHRIADFVYEKLTGEKGVFSTRIAYVVKRGPRFELQIADADGAGEETALASLEPIISPAWSPDGSRLAVSLSRDGGSQLYLVNPDGSNVRRISQSGGIDTEPVFTPDGQSLYFTSDRGGSPQIYRMPANGGEAQRVTFEGTYNVSPRISPDGRVLAYIARNGGKFQVATLDLATRQTQILTDSDKDESPSFAPNGRMILLATVISGRGVLSAVSADGRVKQRLTISAGDVREPAWGPFVR
jgi:TolB protein